MTEPIYSRSAFCTDPDIERSETQYSDWLCSIIGGWGDDDLCETVRATAVPASSRVIAERVKRWRSLLKRLSPPDPLVLGTMDPEGFLIILRAIVTDDVLADAAKWHWTDAELFGMPLDGPLFWNLPDMGLAAVFAMFTLSDWNANINGAWTIKAVQHGSMIATSPNGDVLQLPRWREDVAQTPVWEVPVFAGRFIN